VPERRALLRLFDDLGDALDFVGHDRCHGHIKSVWSHEPLDESSRLGGGGLFASKGGGQLRHVFVEAACFMRQTAVDRAHLRGAMLVVSEPDRGMRDAPRLSAARSRIPKGQPGL